MDGEIQCTYFDTWTSSSSEASFQWQTIEPLLGKEQQEDFGSGQQE